MGPAASSPSNLSDGPASALAPAWQRRGAIEAFLAALVALLFAPSLRYGFVYDDRVVILQNHFIQSWRWLAHDFTTNVWAAKASHSATYYRPLFTVWMRVNYTLFGLRPWGWHLSAVVLHLIATLLVYRLALRLLRSPWQAAVAGAIFAVHPVHVESVAWVCGAVDPLMSIFYLGALLGYLRWRETRSPAAMAFALLLAALAMLTKETAITLPAVVFVYAFVFAENGVAKRVAAALRDVSPFLIVGVLYLLVRHVVLPSLTAAQSSLATVLLTFPGLLLFYARITVWPVGLSLFYDRAPVEHFSTYRVALPLLLLALGVALVVMWLRRSDQSREGTFAVALGFLALAPPLYIGWFSVDDFVHDRYLYLSIAGVAMLVAIALSALGRRKAATSFAPLLQVIAMAAIVLALAIDTGVTQGNWRDDASLWSRCFKIAPHNVRVLNNLASSLGELKLFEPAARLYAEVLRRNPGDGYANGNLGYTLYQMDALPQAEKYLTTAVQIDASDAHSWLYLGVTHLKLGATAEAESDLRQAIALDPAAQGAHLALSVVVEQRGDLKGALAETEQELRYHPEEQSVQQRLQQLRAK